MVRVVILCVFTLFIVNNISAQIKKDIVIDSVKVERDYKSQHKPDRGVGSAVTVINKGEIERNVSRTLSELLLEGSSLQVKSLGQGSLATISFRGTSSSHTKVLWNGIALNPPQLGSFDFSQVPVYFTDGVALYHGGSVAKGGSGGVGGTVAFQNSDRAVEKPEVSLILEGASNNTYTAGINGRFSLGKLTSVTRAFYQHSDNNYRYLNKVYSTEPFYERREDANYIKQGVMQELYYRLSSKNKIYAIGWWQNDKRSLPQPIMVNKVSSENTNDNAVRALLGHNYNHKSHKVENTVAYLQNNLHYTKDMGEIGSINTNNRGYSVIAKSNYRYNGFKKVAIGGDLSYRYDWVESDNFSSGEVSRTTLALSGYLLYRPIRRVAIDAQTTVENINSSTYQIYSLTARYFAIDRYLTIKASNSYNLRVPTLNDLYWYPGGNPDLEPETGKAYDITLESNPRFGCMGVDFATSLYYMDVDNWIIWTPTGNGAIWSPKNLKNVISKGLEVTLDARYLGDIATHTINFSYTYAHSTDNSNNEATQGKQLIYIPRNRWSTGYNLAYRERAWLHYNASFTDARFTSDDESYLTTAYYLHNMEVGYNLTLLGKSISASLKVENIFNTYYESTEFYPMPLRMIWCRIVVLL